MRGDDEQTSHMFSYVSPEQRVPADHPLRAIRALTDEALRSLSRRFAGLYSQTGRPSIPPEQLLRALLLQVLYTVRSERLLMEELNYNLLFRWFVGLNLDDPVWHPTTFTKNRDRLLAGDVATSNTDWTNPHDPDAKVTKMKDGRTHLAHKAEHAVDMETGAIVAVTLQGADVGDTTTIIETAIAATEQVEDAQANVDDRQSLEEIVGDKGYHSNQTLIDLDAVGIRSYVSEPDRGRRDWSKDPEARAPVYGNRRRMRGRRGRRLMRQRGERIRTLVCASLRHGRDAAHPSARPHEHPEAPPDSCGWLQSRARHASSDRDRHAARAAGPRGRCSCDVRGAHGRRPTSAHHDFVVASTHPGRARSARVTGHVCRQLVSGDHLHHGLLGRSSSLFKTLPVSLRDHALEVSNPPGACAPIKTGVCPTSVSQCLA